MRLNFDFSWLVHIPSTNMEEAEFTTYTEAGQQNSLASFLLKSVKEWIENNDGP